MVLITVIAGSHITDHTSGIIPSVKVTTNADQRRNIVTNSSPVPRGRKSSNHGRCPALFEGKYLACPRGHAQNVVSNKRSSIACDSGPTADIGVLMGYCIVFRVYLHIAAPPRYDIAAQLRVYLHIGANQSAYPFRMKSGLSHWYNWSSTQPCSVNTAFERQVPSSPHFSLSARIPLKKKMLKRPRNLMCFFILVLLNEKA